MLGCNEPRKIFSLDTIVQCGPQLIFFLLLSNLAGAHAQQKFNRTTTFEHDAITDI